MRSLAEKSWIEPSNTGCCFPLKNAFYYRSTLTFMRAIGSQYWKTSILMLSFCFKLLMPCQMKIQNPIKHLRCSFRENSERFPSFKTPSQMSDWVLVGVYLLREFFYVKQPLRGVLQINCFEKFSSQNFRHFKGKHLWQSKNFTFLRDFLCSLEIQAWNIVVTFFLKTYCYLCDLREKRYA